MASAEHVLSRWRAHPQYDRVRAWLDSHAAFCAHIQSLRAVSLTLASATPQTPAQEVRGALSRLRQAFEDMDLLLDAHSTLEDTKLFPFLEATFPTEFRGAREQYEQEHGALDAVVDRVRTTLDALAAHGAGDGDVIDAVASRSARELRALVLELDSLMRRHLVAEEERTVELWLGMSAEQQRQYACYRPARAGAIGSLNRAEAGPSAMPEVRSKL